MRNVVGEDVARRIVDACLEERARAGEEWAERLRVRRALEREAETLRRAADAGRTLGEVMRRTAAVYAEFGRALKEAIAAEDGAAGGGGDGGGGGAR